MYDVYIMMRTQIYLPEDLHRELSLLAKQEKKSLSDLIREGAKHVVKEKEKSGKSWLKDIKGIVKKGPKNLSKKIDQTLYSAPYKK